MKSHMLYTFFDDDEDKIIIKLKNKSLKIRIMQWNTQKKRDRKLLITIIQY